MNQRAVRIVESTTFNALVIAVILMNAALIGASTYLTGEPWAGRIALAEWACVALFVLEIGLRFAASKSPLAYFKDGWNVFDLVLVLSAFIPASGMLLPLLRILRVFRVLRLIKAVPELRLIVTVLTRSVASMKHIGLLAGLLFYTYAVIGVKLFGHATSPLRSEYATIHEALFTLFRVLTGDAWAELRYKALEGESGLAVSVTAYHVTWIILSTFILINLIVGAIVNNYQEVQNIEKSRHTDTSDQRLEALVKELQELLAARKNRRG
jgi:voltage-gated sodium channel